MRCQAVLYIGDDYGDNRATIRCDLQAPHEGQQHEERFKRGESEVAIFWGHDEREEGEEPNE